VVTNQKIDNSGTILDWFAKNGPATAMEYASSRSNMKDERASKSEINAARKKLQLFRVVTLVNERLVWLYYSSEEQLHSAADRIIYVPLRELDQAKMVIVRNAMEDLQKRRILGASVKTIARLTGFPPSKIEDEVYAASLAMNPHFPILNENQEGVFS